MELGACNTLIVTPATELREWSTRALEKLCLIRRFNNAMPHILAQHKFELKKCNATRLEQIEMSLISYNDLLRNNDFLICYCFYHFDIKDKLSFA